MSSNPRDPDLKDIWQRQETKEAVMSVEELRMNAKRFLRRKQRDLLARTGFVIFAAVSFGIFAMNNRITSLRVVAGLVMTMLLLSAAWSLLLAYRKSRGEGPAVPGAPMAAMTSCLEFYRNELERQREYARQPTWQLITVLLIIAWMTRDALMRNSTDPFRGVLPYVLFAAAGMIVLMAVRKHQARRVQADIDALDVFEDEMLAGGSHDTAVDEHQK